MMCKLSQIIAYVNGNLGDDLFVKILCERYPNQKFLLCGPKKYKDYFEYLDNLKYISNDTLILKIIYKLISVVRKFAKKSYIYRDKLLINIVSKYVNENILITGSYFVETPYRLDEAKMELPFYKNNSYILNCNFGPYSSDEFYSEFVKYFSMTKWISFRDKASYELFRTLSNVHYGPDVACAVKTECNEAEDYVVMSVMDFSFIMDGKWKNIASKYIDKMEEIIRYHISLNKKVYIMSFCEDLGDLRIAKNLAKRIDNDKIIIWDYGNYKMNASLNMLAKSQLVYASRFHAMILGLVFGKKVIPFCYSNKMDNILQDLGFNKDTYRIDNLICKKVEEYDNLCIKLSQEDINMLSQKSEKHFESLDKKIKK